MSTREKLKEAMNNEDLSGFQQTAALVLYDTKGLAPAMQYVNEIVISKRLGVIK